MASVVWLVFVCALSSMSLAACGNGNGGTSSSAMRSTPETDLISEGKSLYEETCAGCHGIDLKGTKTGPPFLDAIYAPDHHPDESFFAAVDIGVQPHHWDFGPMPPQPTVNEEEVTAIIAYVRSEQARAGITEDPSHP